MARVNTYLLNQDPRLVIILFPLKNGMLRFIVFLTLSQRQALALKEMKEERYR